MSFLDTAAGTGEGRRLVAWAGYPWIVLAASLLVQTAASFGNQSISPLAPFLVQDLGLTRGQVGLVVTASYVGATFVLVLAGNLSDRFGVRALFLLGLVAAGVPLALAAQVPTFAWLLLPMALYGLGNGFALPPTTRAIVEWFPARRRGLAMGIKQTGVALAGVIAGLVVPSLAAALGWRGALLVLGLVTLASGALAWLTYRDRDPDPGVVGAVVRPGLRALLGNHSLLVLCGVTWLYAAVQLSIIGFLVLYLREQLGLGLAASGALLSLAQTGGVIGRIGWGLVSDVLFGGRRKPVLGLIGALAAASSLALSVADARTPAPVVWLVLLLTGLSAIGWNGINMTFVAEIAGRRVSATAAGMNLTASYAGILIGPPLFGLLVDWSRSYAVAFQAGAVVYALALALLWRVKTPAAAPAARSPSSPAAHPHGRRDAPTRAPPARRDRTP